MSLSSSPGQLAEVTVDAGAPGSAGVAGPTSGAWLALAREVAADRLDRAVFAIVALVVGVGYSVLLPFDYTQRISLANWRYLDAPDLAFSALFALGMAWVLTLQVHAMRRLARTAIGSGRMQDGGPLGTLAVALSLLPSFLCCSPVVPTVVGLVGLSATARLRAVGAVQFFFAAEQTPLLLTTGALLVGSVLWSTRQVVRARCRANQACCALPDERTDESAAGVHVLAPADSRCGRGAADGGAR